MSSRPRSNSGRMSSDPSASCMAPQPLGMAAVSVNGAWTTPIGENVSIGQVALSAPEEQVAPDLVPLRGFVEHGDGIDERKAEAVRFAGHLRRCPAHRFEQLLSLGR